MSKCTCQTGVADSIRLAWGIRPTLEISRTDSRCCDLTIRLAYDAMHGRPVIAADFDKPCRKYHTVAGNVCAILHTQGNPKALDVNKPTWTRPDRRYRS